MKWLYCLADDVFGWELFGPGDLIPFLYYKDVYLICYDNDIVHDFDYDDICWLRLIYAHDCYIISYNKLNTIRLKCLG